MEQTNATNEAPKRPVFLTVLCILSFIAAGFGILAYVAAIALAGAASAVVSAASDAAASEGFNTAMATYSGPSAGLVWAYVIVGFVSTLVGLFGVIKMWKLKKMGFYLYTGASVASMVMGIIFSGFSAMAVVIPVAFIVMYGLNLKSMK